MHSDRRVNSSPTQWSSFYRSKCDKCRSLYPKLRCGEVFRVFLINATSEKNPLEFRDSAKPNFSPFADTRISSNGSYALTCFCFKIFFSARKHTPRFNGKVHENSAPYFKEWKYISRFLDVKIVQMYTWLLKRALQRSNNRKRLWQTKIYERLININENSRDHGWAISTFLV